MAEQSFSFALGVIVSQNRDTLLKKCNMKTIWIVSLASLLVGIAALGIKQIPIIRGAEGYRFVYLLCQLFIKLPLGLFLMIVLHSLNLKGIGILAFVGTIAYELYLVQMPYLETLQNSYSRTFIFVLQTLLMSYILYKMDNIIIKKLQFLNT